MSLDPNRFDIIPYADLSPESSWKRVGKGSFGCVFRGEYLGLDVAIKEVLDSTEYDVDKYFKRELTIMQESRHPNIVQYVGLCLAPPAPTPLANDHDDTSSSTADSHETQKVKKPKQRILIVSEFLQGGNVRHYIAATNLPFPWRLRLSFCVDAARALAYMHARKCMHRDLKGENMLLMENHRVKICDFGFARIAPTNSEEMKRISFCGTDGYMSPEILAGEDFSLETDVFSLGVIFCEILTRTLVDPQTMSRPPPFFAIDEEEVKSLATEECPQAFLELAFQCCSVQPHKRPSMREILQRLRSIEQDVLAADQRREKDPAEKTYNIGSLNFGGGLKTRKQLSRPSMTGRIPSFEGAIKMNSKSSSPSNSDEEAIEDILKALHGVSVDTTQTAPLEAAKDGASSKYSTMVIGSRGSKNTRVMDSWDGSSFLTVKAGGQQWSNESGNAVPSLPESWLDQLPEVAALLLGTEDEPKILNGYSTPTTESIIDSTERSEEEQSLPVSQTSSTNVVFNGVFAENGEVFFMAHEEYDQALHRFSLVRPGWHLFTTMTTPASALQQLKDFLRADTNPSPPQSVAAGEETALLRGQRHRRGLELQSSIARCDFCKRYVGWRKPYLCCDDCGFHCHIACGDIAPRSCGVAPDALPELDKPSQQNKLNNHIRSKLKKQRP